MSGFLHYVKYFKKYFIAFFAAFLLGTPLGVLFYLIFSKSTIQKVIFQEHILAEAFLFIICFLLSIILHEICHALYFMRHGLKMRAIAIFFLVMLNDGCGNWKIKFFPNHLTAFGGIAIPDLPPVRNEEEFNILKNIYARALRFAPNCSCGIGIISLSILLCVALLNIEASGTLYSILLLVAFSNISIFLSSFVGFSNIMGDYKAYSSFKNDKKFALLQIAQYILFGSEWESTIKQSEWIIGELLTFISIPPETFSTIDLAIVDLLIQLSYLDVTTLSLEHPVKLCAFKIMRENYGANNEVNQAIKDILYCHSLMFLLDRGIISRCTFQTEYTRHSEKLFDNCSLKPYYEHLMRYKFSRRDSDREWICKHMQPTEDFSFYKLFPCMLRIEESIINYFFE